MAKINIIRNGNFDRGDEGWQGKDLETMFPEDAYLGNGSKNAVAEMDGNKDATTVMEQVVVIERPQKTFLTFRTALRKESTPNAGSEGFLVEILNSKGEVVAAEKVFPDGPDWMDVKLAVTFDQPDKYTVRFTELGTDDSLGAIVDDVSLLVCFAAGTLIDTKLGQRRVERLARGDLVWTADGGYRPIRWIATRRVTVADQIANPALRPVCLRAGALGAGQPAQDLYISQQHRLCISGWQAELWHGVSEVLVPAVALVDGDAIQIMPPQADITYVHFLLDGHHLVRSNGLESESFFPTALSLKGVARQARAELARLFPTMAALTAQFTQTARPVMRPYEARLVT